MASKINILSEDTVAKIAAGEVVERPASVIKELVENSIDADADSIEISIQGAGQALIRIADNGDGMTAEDMDLACRQHTTSKISEADDLYKINSLGFRGEALSSIAAVSQMDITTRAKDADKGVYSYLESGQILKTRPAGRAQGTTVEVRNLFYNVPARRKFLRKESTELAEIVNVVGRFVLAYPDVEFKLSQGDRGIIHATRDMGPAERIKLILGGDVSDQMVTVENCKDKYKVRGYVSRPSATRKDKRSQVFFVNGRFVKSRVLNDAVQESYKSLLEKGRYPAAVLFVSAEPDEVDVNVHPTKLQIKFGDDRGVKDAVQSAINEAFDTVKAEEFERSAQEHKSTRAQVVESEAAEDLAPEMPIFAGSPEVQTEFGYKKTYGARPSGRSFPGMFRDPAAASGTSSIFQLGGCYIVQVCPEEIKVTDQHAAHERVLYEFFSRATEENPVEVQNLLFPVRMDLSADESVLMEKVTGAFRVLGFVVEHFGDRSFIVQAVPAIIKDSNIKTVLYDALSDLSSSGTSKKDMVDELVKIMSCRAAVKSGDPMTDVEMTSLLDQLGRCELPFTCPHGRPTTFDITTEELEKRFRRK